MKLAINLSFSCSLRMGEMLGLTWDCVEISDASIANGTAFVFVNKELQRVNRDALEKLNEKGIVFKFPAFVARTNTALGIRRNTAVSCVDITTTLNANSLLIPV